MRQHIQTDLKQKYKTVDEAEDVLALSVEAYLDDSILSNKTTPSPVPLHISQALLDQLNHLTPVQLKEIIVQSLQLLSKLHTPPTTLLIEVANAFVQMDWMIAHLFQLFENWFKNASLKNSVLLLNKCFDICSKKIEITTNVSNFPQLSLSEMKKLQDLDKSNTVYNLSKVISESRPDGSNSLMPLKRMPFGMIQFTVDFFASTNVNQVYIVNKLYF